MQTAFLSPRLLESISEKIRLQKDKPGLYLVSTPIGNIFDISFRALHILKQSKIIFAEDTRNSKKILNFYEIDVPLFPCHEYNEVDASVVDKIKRGEVYSLVSDAGTPTISDPGYRIVNWCLQNGFDVFPIPGACAFIAGLSTSGLPTDKFSFFGFLPNKTNARRKFLDSISGKTETLIFLESPKRLAESLGDLLDCFGDRNCCVCREITKVYEDFRRGKLSEVAKHFEDREPLGEIVIIVAGNKNTAVDEEEIFAELSELLESHRLKESVNMVCEKYFGITKLNRKQIYHKALQLKETSKKNGAETS